MISQWLQSASEPAYRPIRPSESRSWEPPNEPSFRQEAWGEGFSLTARLKQMVQRHRSFFASLQMILAVALVAGTSFALGFACHRPTDKACTKKLSAPSPFLNSVQYEWTTFENEFWKESRYRGAPTEELEEAWDELWNYGSFRVPHSMLPGLNKTAEGLRDFAPEQGGGAVGLLEVFHQIHCLNMIRQYSYRDQWDYSSLESFQGPEHLVRAHVDHCIETLRINLMCTADVTPFLVRKNPLLPLGIEPDFNTLHKCRRWDQIVKTAKDLEVYRVEDPAHTHQNQ